MGKLLQDIKAGKAGKVKIHGVMIEEAVYPLMNVPEDAKQKEMKMKLRKGVFEAWENGVSDCR